MICPSCSWDLEAVVLWSADLVLPLTWPSQNTMGAIHRGSAGWKYRRYRAAFEGCLRKYTKAVPKATKFRRAWLTRCWGRRKRAYDMGNLIGGGKALIDGMVTLGYLIDDSPEYFLGSYHQEKAVDGKDSIRIRLEEVSSS